MTQEELAKEKEKELAEREGKLKQYELKLAKIDYFKEKGYDINLVYLYSLLFLLHRFLVHNQLN